MKKITIALLITSVITLTYSCSKEEIIIIQEAESTSGNAAVQQPCLNSITYPDSAFYGRNILAYPDSSTISVSPSYSFFADLDCDATLEIRMYMTAGSAGCWWYYGTNNGWQISPFNSSNASQIFQTINPGDVNLSMFLGGSGNCPGTGRIDFYENNSATVTKSKYIFWQ